MPKQRKFPIVPVLLVVLPAWLIGSACFALFKYFDAEKEAAAEAGKLFARSVSTPQMADDLRKIVNVIGERNTSQPKNLKATSSMIEGLLGPSNTGYEVKSINGPAEFPVLMVTIPTKKADSSPVWILTSYDSPVGSRGADKNASGLTATLATAQALANSYPAHPIHFLFLPHVNEIDSPVAETVTIAANLIKSGPTVKAVLCGQAMASSETLILSSRDTEAIPVSEFKNLGKVLGAEVVCLGEDFDLASVLFEMGIPALRIATRPMLLPDENDDRLPFAPTLAASTGRFIQLTKRLAKIVP